MEPSFLSHQEALLDLDLDSARERSEAALREHAGAEEEHLLPVYARAGTLPGGAADLFLGEHRKMLGIAGRIGDALRTLGAADPGLRRRVLSLFDDEAVLKSLLARHHERERNLLYPTLDRVTTAAERRALLSRLLQRGSGSESRRRGPGRRPAESRGPPSAPGLRARRPAGPPSRAPWGTERCSRGGCGA